MHSSYTRPIPPSAAGAISRLAADHVRAAGIDPALILNRAGLMPSLITDRNARIDVGKQVAFLDLAAEALGDNLFGFHLAEDADLRAAGLLYFVIASSATLGDALTRAERYSGISNEGIVLHCMRASDLAIRYTYVGVPRHADRHQVEFWTTALVRIARQVTNTNLRPIRINLVHPRCSASDRLEAFFGCPVRFNASEDTVAFARGAADLPLAGADPYLNDLLIGYCEEALARRSRPAEAIRTRVENAITPLLPHGKARASEVARSLAMSQRTLARRLGSEGLTFIGVLEEIRTDLARHYLKDASLSVSRIAWLLGYHEVGAFTHAFKRWTGQTPTQFRALKASGHGMIAVTPESMPS
jgi:AraC-like DNA-binding protein